MPVLLGAILIWYSIRFFCAAPKVRLLTEAAGVMAKYVPEEAGIKPAASEVRCTVGAGRLGLLYAVTATVPVNGSDTRPRVSVATAL